VGAYAKRQKYFANYKFITDQIIKLRQLAKLYPHNIDMSFQLPDTFSKTIENPRKYELLLNKLALAGFDTRMKLVLKPKKVIQTIEELVGAGDDEKTKHKKRYFLSAILWVMTPAYREKANPYHTYWQRVMPSTNDATGEPWVKRSAYTPN
jgi:hypothetical protein